MNNAAQRPFWLALALSLLLHFVALTAPGWRLPLDEDESAVPALAATLVAPRPPPTPAIQPRSKPKPAPRTEPRPAPPKPADSAPADSLALPAPPPEPVAEPLPASPPEPPPEPSAPVGETLPAVPPAPTFAGEWPRSGRIVYQVTRGEGGLIIGEAEHAWQHDGNTYELRAVTQTTGLAALFRPARVVQESRGVFAAGGLQPVEFKTERDGKPKDSVRFDAAQGRIFFGRGGSAEFVPDAQDLLSLFHALSVLRDEAGTYALTVATGRRLSRYEVTIAGMDRLPTSLGEFQARHIKISGPAVEDATEVWYDKDTNLPLKIRHRDRKGEIYDQVATQIELKESLRETQ